MPLAAVIFDFDGVLVDTEPLHHRAFQDVIRDEGLRVAWPEYLDSYVGCDDRDALRLMFRRADRPLDDRRMRDLMGRKAVRFEELVMEKAPPLREGVRAALHSFRGRVPIGLCSGAVRSDIEPVLDEHGIGDYFDAIVTAEDLPVSKPSPDPYRLAVERLDGGAGRLAPPRCAAVEDTPTGIESAAGAGLFVVGVQGTFHPDCLCAANAVIGSMKDLTLDVLQRMMDEA
jgi:beta-phosphoglucomutase